MGSTFSGPAQPKGTGDPAMRLVPSRRTEDDQGDAALVTSATGPPYKSQRPGVALLANIVANSA